jgi:hypothetical protein
MCLHKFIIKEIIKYMEKLLWKLKMSKAAGKNRGLQQMLSIFLQATPHTQSDTSANRIHANFLNNEVITWCEVKTVSCEAVFGKDQLYIC